MGDQTAGAGECVSGSGEDAMSRWRESGAHFMGRQFRSGREGLLTLLCDRA